MLVIFLLFCSTTIYIEKIRILYKSENNVGLKVKFMIISRITFFQLEASDIRKKRKEYSEIARNIELRRMAVFQKSITTRLKGVPLSCCKVITNVLQLVNEPIWLAFKLIYVHQERVSLRVFLPENKFPLRLLWKYFNTS